MPKTPPTPDWNPWSPEAAVDPHGVQADLRRRCPFPYTDQHGGFRSITRYADVTAAALDTNNFKSGLRPKFTHPMAPLETDPPDHAAYRRLLQPFFGVTRMRKLEDGMRTFAIEVLAPLIACGEADFASEFAFVLPIRAFCFLLDLPDADWPRIKAWSTDAYTVYANIPERRARFDAANAAIFDYAHRLLAARRSSPRDPADDLVTALSHARVDDHPLSDATIVAMIRLLLTAGHESTASGIANSMLHLAQTPDAQSLLRAEPGRIPVAVEEMLRFETPVMAMPRVVAAPVTLSGHRFETGENVHLLFASGNRDAEKFADADTCLLDRRPNPHLAFGHGVHTCIGASLARVEIKLALEELLGRTRSFALNGAVTRPLYHRRGVTALPLAVVPR